MSLYLFVIQNTEPGNDLLHLHRLRIFLLVKFGGTIINETNNYLLWNCNYKLSKSIITKSLGIFMQNIRYITDINSEISIEDVDEFVQNVHLFQTTESDFSKKIKKCLFTLLESFDLENKM